MENLTNNSLKEYYVKLLEMYNNALSMINAMNQALSTSSSEVSVTLVSGDDTETTLRIPSMLYLENKVEQLQNNFESLFRMPTSGEAWFTNNADMFKLELVTTGTTPIQPVISSNGTYASITDNNFLRDLVSPKTFLRLDIDNLPDNIEKMFMKKIIFHNLDAFKTIQAMQITTYEEYSAAMYNLVKGVDYDCSEQDARAGIIRFLPNGSLKTGDAVLVSASVPERTFSNVSLGDAGDIEGELLFVGDANVGINYTIEGWRVKVSPDGDLSGLISSDFGSYKLKVDFLDDSEHHPQFPYAKVTAIERVSDAQSGKGEYLPEW